MDKKNISDLITTALTKETPQQSNSIPPDYLPKSESDKNSFLMAVTVLCVFCFSSLSLAAIVAIISLRA